MRYDAVIVGAGFAGIHMLHRLAATGLSVRLIEAGSDVGGVWYWNRYPGARCDVESIDYQFYFSDEILAEWRWPERYSEGPVIQRYLSFVTDRLGLRDMISFGTRIETADYDERSHQWRLATDRGDSVETRYLILATGPLTVSLKPEFPGMADYKGRILHTAHWPREPIDFAGRNVAIIGTGSSGVQAAPVIARQAKSLTVFQRTPTYSMPVANRALSDDEIADARARTEEYRALRFASPGGLRGMGNPKKVADDSPAEREKQFADRWTMGGFAFLMSYADIMIDAEANEQAASFVYRKIREKVKDPATAEKLIPASYPLGTKRPCLDTGYFEMFNEPHVSLVDARDEPIERFDANGIVAGGKSHVFDDIVLATGFDAMTGAIMKIAITGRNGEKLGDHWADGPRSYLGIAVAGFPNLFILDGPGSPSIIVNAPAMIETQGDWLAQCIQDKEARGIAAIEADRGAEEEWTAHVHEVANYTLYPRADSWAMGANIPGKPRGFMMYLGGLIAYRDKCREVAEAGYAGFALTRAQAPADA